jgi:hypothetical protein
LRLKHLEIREDVGSGDNYRTLTDTLSRRREEGTLVRFELLLQEYMPIPFADAMAAFRALADRGLHVRVTHDAVVLLDSHPAGSHNTFHRFCSCNLSLFFVNIFVVPFSE